MATCLDSPTLTLFSTSTSSTVITTSTVTVQTQPDGSVTTATIPLIVTSIVTIVNPTSTLYASCSSTPISTIPDSLSSTTPQPSQSPSFAPTTIVITTTPSPTVITTRQSSTLANGGITVLTITTTSTPTPDVIVFSTSVVPTQSQASKSSNVVPIAAGAAGGFIFLIAVVVAAWFIFKKCRKPNTSHREEDEIPFPNPVMRDRHPVDLSRPYEYGHVGRPMPTTGPGSSPGMVNNTYASDGRRDSATSLIGTGLTPRASNSGTLASIPGFQNQVRGGDVGRQPSHGSAHQLPPGAARPGGAPPMDHYSPSSTGRSSVSGSSATGPGPSNRRPLQVMNAALSPVSMHAGFSQGDVPNSSSGPMGVPDSARLEKQDIPSSSSGPVMYHSDGGHIQSSGHRPSASGSGSVFVPEVKPSTQPEPTSSNVEPEPNEPPPAYVA